jgi:hypothetical protein
VLRFKRRQFVIIMRRRAINLRLAARGLKDKNPAPNLDSDVVALLLLPRTHVPATNYAKMEFDLKKEEA